MKRIEQYILTPFPARFALTSLIFSLSIISMARAQTFAPSPSPTVASVQLTKCWSYSTGDAVDEAMASNGNRVFLGGPAAKIEAVSLDGKKMWSSELGGDMSSNLLATDSALFLVTSTASSDAVTGGGILRSLSNETGITNWTLRLTESGTHFLGGAPGLVIDVSSAGLIQAFDVKNGAVKWKRQLADGFRSRPAFTTGKVFVASTDNQIFGVSIPSGEVSLVQKFIYPITAIAATGENDIVFGDERGNVTSYSISTSKTNWRFKSGGEISGILSLKDHILATSHDNFVYWILNRNGGVVWKKRMAGRITQIADVPDQFTLISSLDDRSALLAERDNGKVVGQIVLNPDETVTGVPVIIDGLILVLTNQSAYGFRINGCGPKIIGGAGKLIPGRQN